MAAGKIALKERFGSVVKLCGLRRNAARRPSSRGFEE